MLLSLCPHISMISRDKAPRMLDKFLGRQLLELSMSLLLPLLLLVLIKVRER